MLLIFFAAQLNVWNKNTEEESSHDFLVYLARDLWLWLWLWLAFSLSLITIRCSITWRSVRLFVLLLRFGVFVWCSLMCMSLYESNEWITIAFNFERAISLFRMAHCHKPKMIYLKTMFLSFSMLVSVLSLNEVFSVLCSFLFSTVGCKLCEYSQWMDLRVNIYTCKM